tara:strand:+ start:290 stop:475 length:186 start_codon:yes stop_codon:yes gene_type:complete
MTEETLYRIEELQTIGWAVLDSTLDCNLTKEQCKVRYDHYLSQGLAPERLRVSVELTGNVL